MDTNENIIKDENNNNGNEKPNENIINDKNNNKGNENIIIEEEDPNNKNIINQSIPDEFSSNYINYKVEYNPNIHYNYNPAEITAIK